LFHSVQLNVNNPHFLIMQGRITKVLNMKPPEILGMIEEAAGTRMYEMKKLAAQKTIEKKQTKVDEINKILAEEITPTLEKLRKERANYQQWVHNNTELERLTRFCIAHEFWQLEEALRQGAEGGAALQQTIVDLREKGEEFQIAMQSRETEMHDLLKQVL
jgi:structural maintenance of chromosome 2